MGQDLDDWIFGGQSAARATAEPKLLPLCADGHARRFSFARRAEDLPAPRMQGRWHEAVKNSAFLLNISFNFC